MDKKTIGTLKDPVRVMKRAMKHASRDFAREILTAVHLDECGDVVATDSYRLYVEHGAWDGPSIDVPNSVAKAMAKCKVKGNDEAVIRVDGEMVIARMGDGTELKDGAVENPHGYPNYKRLFDGLESKTVAYMMAKEMLNEVKTYVSMRAEGMAFDITKSRDLVVSAWSENWNGNRVFEKECDGEPVSVSMNPNYAKAALSTFTEDVVEAHITSPERPVVFKGGSIEILVAPTNAKKPKNMVKTAKESKSMEKPKPTGGEPVKINGKSFVFTGGLKNLTRRTVEEKVRKLGGRVAHKVGKTTDYAVATETGTAKYRDAVRMGTRIVSEDEFLTALAFAEKLADDAIDMDVSVHEDGGITAVVMEPAKVHVAESHGEKVVVAVETHEDLTDEQVEQIAEAAKREAEHPIEEVVAEMATETAKLSFTTKEEADAVMETLRELLKDGNCVVYRKKGKGACIRVGGETKPYKDELNALGLRYWKGPKEWMLKPEE